MLLHPSLLALFFLHATATTEIYTLSLHDALPIYVVARMIYGFRISVLFGLALTFFSSIIGVAAGAVQGYFGGDRKSTRLNSSHVAISYAVFCLKKKKNKHIISHQHIKGDKSDVRC